MKFDQEKARMGLLPPRALCLVSDVLTFGAKKYLPNNWKHVENGPERYLDAALRHITAYMTGEKKDQETGLPHMAHALCCLMFIADLEAEEEIESNPCAKVELPKNTSWPFPTGIVDGDIDPPDEVGAEQLSWDDVSVARLHKWLEENFDAEDMKPQPKYTSPMKWNPELNVFIYGNKKNETLGDIVDKMIRNREKL
jgi:hypothetical protein